MEISFHKYSKFIFLAMTLIMALGIFLPAGTSVYAAEKSNEVEEVSDEEVNLLLTQLSDEMQFVYNNAVQVDSEGYIESVDINKLKEQYGDNNYFSQYESQAIELQNQHIRNKRDLNSYGQCVINGLANSLGINAIKQAFNNQVIQAIKSKAFQKASQMLFNNLVKVMGKKAATFALKKAIGAALPGSMAGMIIWNAGKCAPKLWS